MNVAHAIASFARRLYRNGTSSQAAIHDGTTLAAQADAVGSSVSGWLTRRRSAAALYVGASARAVARLAERYPDRRAATLAAAERAIRHEFDLLGSGLFVPVDPERPVRDSYRPIDWYLDPVRKLRFPRGVPHKDWKLYEMRPGNADIKYPWELARCQHWATLGQAFMLSGDERFAREIFDELDDFVEANPAGIGINWTCTMDVALRAVNWAVGLQLVRHARTIDSSAWERAYAALFEHGVFIRQNLENTYEVTSNHFLSNVVGLWFLGATFADLLEGRAWAAFARESLEHEIDVQVLNDGADFESAVPYHRLVTELFLGSARLADVSGGPLSHRYRERVRDMVAFLAGVLRPDGLMPQVGDADDGRLHVLAAPAATPQDARHLFGPAGLMFGDPEWIALGGETGSWEAAWWGFDVDEVAAGSGGPKAIARLFPDAGLASARDAHGHYLLITNGIVGTKGFGNHKHNDQLGFEYHVSGVPLLVDPGSFVYTADPAARNQFRSTSFHNTLEIDGTEQNELNPDWLFRLFETARAETLEFAAGDRVVDYRGRHVGYARLDAPVTHERRFRFDRRTGSLLIGDRLEGRGSHALRWHFHVAPGVGVAQQTDRSFLLSAGEVRVRFDVPPDLAASVAPAWYSPSYGVRLPCSAIDLRALVLLDGVRTWVFVFRDASMPDADLPDAVEFIARLHA